MILSHWQFQSKYSSAVVKEEKYSKANNAKNVFKVLILYQILDMTSNIKLQAENVNNVLRMHFVLVKIKFSQKQDIGEFLMIRHW